MYVSPPQLEATALPDAERSSAKAINSNLSSLSAAVKMLHAALVLFDTSEGNKAGPGPFAELEARRERNVMLADWQILAARMGAITIYEFRQADLAIGKLLKDCPTIQAALDDAASKEAARLFRESFPDFEGLRHFAAHGSEMTAFPEGNAKHTAAGGLDVGGFVAHVESVLVSCTLFGRFFTSTFKGKVAKYEMSIETVQNLARVRDAKFRAFGAFDRR